MGGSSATHNVAQFVAFVKQGKHAPKKASLRLQRLSTTGLCLSRLIFVVGNHPVGKIVVAVHEIVGLELVQSYPLEILILYTADSA